MLVCGTEISHGCLSTGHGRSVFSATQDEYAPRLVKKLNGVKVEKAAGGLMNSGVLAAILKEATHV